MTSSAYTTPTSLGPWGAGMAGYPAGFAAAAAAGAGAYGAYQPW